MTISQWGSLALLLISIISCCIACYFNGKSAAYLEVTRDKLKNVDHIGPSVGAKAPLPKEK